MAFWIIETESFFSRRSPGKKKEISKEKRNKNIYWTPAIALITGTLACGASETAKLCKRKAAAPKSCPIKNKILGLLEVLSAGDDWNKAIRTLGERRKLSAAKTEPNDINKNPLMKESGKIPNRKPVT